jgi:hypothetical protein
MPWGMAKQIVAMMRIGDTVIVRPEYSVAFHNAARRMGRKVSLKPFRKRGKLRYQLKRVELNAPTAHAFRQHNSKGHFLAA